MRSRPVAVLAFCVVACNVVYGASLAFLDRPESGYLTLWDGWVLHVALALPAGLTLVRAMREREARLEWSILTAGIVANVIADLQFTYFDWGLTSEDFPAASDIGYLFSNLAFAVAFALLTQRRSGASRAVRLDGLIIGLAGGAVALALWFEPILEQSGSTAAVLVGIAYPILDLVYLVLVLAALAPTGFRPTPTLAVLMLGIASFAIGDVVFLRQIAADTYVPGTLLELSWSVGVACFGLAAVVREGARGARHAHRGSVQAMIPLLAGFAALAIVAIALTGHAPGLAATLAVGAIAAVLCRVAMSIRDLRLANEAFSQARTDDLTGLTNRRGFVRTLEERFAANDQPEGVMMIDLDGFKEVNDSLGHHAGDHLLTIVARRFEHVLPANALVARLGGDEFGVAVPGDAETTRALARDLLASLDNPVSIEEMTIRVGASIGIALFPEHGTSTEAVMRSADVAMYDAKTNQRGVAIYDPARDPHSRERLALIEDLRTAIDQRAFHMHYQPTIDVRTRRTVGMEALIRWNHPTRGMLAPDEFIPLAERVGLIPAITRAVIDISVADLAALRAQDHDLGLSVNISAKDLVDEELPRYVVATLRAHDVPPQRLTLEITETALSLDSERAERTLSALRAAGVRISIDDFGVGYSSMSQLLRLPLDELKIDRSFVENLDHDQRARAILSATVELGRNLGLNVVAEGIESAHAFDTVAGHGVEIAQGFLFSRPLPADEFASYVTPTADVAQG